MLTIMECLALYLTRKIIYTQIVFSPKLWRMVGHNRCDDKLFIVYTIPQICIIYSVSLWSVVTTSEYIMFKKTTPLLLCVVQMPSNQDVELWW